MSIKIIKENDNVFLEMTKKEFDEKYFVGCLVEYDSNGLPESVVKIKCYGIIPDLKKCVLKKPNKDNTI